MRFDLCDMKLQLNMLHKLLKVQKYQLESGGKRCFSYAADCFDDLELPPRGIEIDEIRSI